MYVILCSTIVYLNIRTNCVYVCRILASTHRMRDKGTTGPLRTFEEDVLLSRAQAARPTVYNNLEKITSLAKISRRKHDQTHRKWFGGIIKAIVGEDVFQQVNLDFSSTQLQAAKEMRWANNRAKHWVPCKRSAPDAPSCLRCKIEDYLTQYFEDFGPLLERQIKYTRVCMQSNQLDLCKRLGIRPCTFRHTRGFVDTATGIRVLHCSRICDAGNLYQMVRFMYSLFMNTCAHSLHLLLLQTHTGQTKS